MTKVFLLAISVALMVFCLQGDLLALTYEGLPLERAVLTSDAIVIGTVAGVEGRGEDGKGSGTWTYVTVMVNEAIKGQNVGRTIEVKTHLSARPDDPDYGLPRFSIDEKVLLLLTKHENRTGVYWMRDSYEGKFTSINGRIAGSSIKLEEFIQQIQELLAGQRSKITVDIPRHIWSSTSVEEMTWGQVKTNFK